MRFVVGSESAPAHMLDGVFQFGDTQDCVPHCLPEKHEAIEAAYEWFNQHLIVPPLLKSCGSSPTACWFRSDAGEMLVRIWELANLLRDLGLGVRYVWTNHPGPIVYYDEHQIVTRRPVPGRRCDCYWELTL